MVKKRKLLRRILSGSKDIRFHDFVSLMESFGFELKRVRGSHHIFGHPNLPVQLSIQPTKTGQVKGHQLHQFLDLVEEYNLKLEEDEEEEA